MSGLGKGIHGSLYLWGCSIQEMGGDVVIGRSIYGVVVIDGSLYSRFYGMYNVALYMCMTHLCSLEYKVANYQQPTGNVISHFLGSTQGSRVT